MMVKEGMILKLFDVSTYVPSHMVQETLPSSKSVCKKPLAIALPSTIESVLISLIGAVDSMMVGTIGADAIAAVGITTQPKFIILCMILSLNIGVTVVVSHRKGEGNRLAANQCMKQAWLISAIISLILSVVGFVFAKEILTFAGATSDYIDLAMIYFRAIMVGNFFNCMSLTINAAQKGSGNTKIAMKTNVTANLINLVFNYFLINGIAFFPKWGVLGAGVATSLGNFVAFVMSIYSITVTKGYIHFDIKEKFKFDKKTFKDIYKIASSAFVEQVFLRLGFFMYSKTIAGLGMIAFAAHNVCMNVLHISFSFGDGLSVATSSLVGQSLGAKRKDLAMIYSKATQRIGNCIGIILGIFVILFRVQIVSLFTNDPIIIETAANIMFIITVTLFFQISQVVTYGCLRSAGDVKFTALLSLISVTLVRPGLTWVLVNFLHTGLIGAWIGLFLDQIVRFGGSKWRHRKGNWVNIEI